MVAIESEGIFEEPYVGKPPVRFCEGFQVKLCKRKE